jgi:acetate kinase
MPYILTINSGSSSLKFSLYNMGQAEALSLRRQVHLLLPQRIVIEINLTDR